MRFKYSVELLQKCILHSIFLEKGQIGSNETMQPIFYFESFAKRLRLWSWRT